MKKPRAKYQRSGYRRFETDCMGKTFIVLIHGTTNMCLIHQKYRRVVISTPLSLLVNRAIQLEYGTLNL